MNRSWVRFPQAAQIRPPGTGWAFLYALTGRAAWCARGRRPARENATREPAARSGRSGSPARPRHRPRAPQPGPPVPPVPSTPVGRVADVWLGRSPRSPPWPCHRPRAPRPSHAIAHRHRSEAPPQPVGITGSSRAAISGRSLVCCYKRRQSAVFFVWLSVPLLQMSSIRRLFR